MNNTYSKKNADLLIGGLQTNNYGLHNGKMGLCLAYFQHGRHMDSPEYTQKANDLLLEISENIGEVEGYSFNDGLLGIGWTIEFLAQNNFIEINTDDFLEDLDDELYKLVMYSKAQSLHLNTGTLGRILYLYKRLMAKNTERNFYKDVCNKECLVLLIDELYENLAGAEHAILNQDINQLDQDTVKTIGQALIMTCKLIPLQLNFENLNEIICKTTSKIEEYFINVSSEGYLSTESLSLMNAWYEAGVILKVKDWTEKSQKIVERINAVQDSDEKIFISNKLSANSRPLGQISILKTLHDLSLETKEFSWSEAWLLQ